MVSQAHVDSSNLCWTFAKTGQCPRGSACRWTHEVLAKDPSDTVCRAWRLWGTCPRYDQCTWHHPPVAVKWSTVLSSQRSQSQEAQACSLGASYWTIVGSNLEVTDAESNAGSQLRWLYAQPTNTYSDPMSNNENAMALRIPEKGDVCYQVDKPLQPWNETCDTPSTHLAMTPISLNTELDDMGDSSGPWDQFEVNKNRFGVKSTFCEDLSQYTTQLKLSEVPLDIQQMACQIAEEIEKEHQVGVDSDGYKIGRDDEEDEEAKFSSVTRMAQQLQ